MFNFWQRLGGVFLITSIALMIGIFAGTLAGLVFFSLSLLWLVIHHTKHLAALEQWLLISDHTPSSIPPGSGIWDNIFALLARYVRMQNQSKQLINLELKQLQSVTAAMPDGIVILDERGHIEWCDPVAEKHLGINLELDVGHQITNMVRQRSFVEYLTAGKFNKPLILKQMRHHRLTLLMQLVSYGDRQKLLISRDITSYERIEAMRRDFIANVSHELRTPLTVVIGYLEVLTADPDIDEGMRDQALKAMTEQTMRMQHLVEDLLTLSRLENTLNKLSESRVNIAPILHELHREAESLSGGRHTVELNIDSEDQILASREELRSAFSNLISNAIRYTPEGGEIGIRWKVRDKKGLFIVWDTGVGIESEHIPRLTERFYRVDSSRSRETGGTGLGLAIVKHILNRHQARLKIKSAVGKGSEFCIEFPEKRLIKKS
ncbi:two-component system, OmpR family, phosphate regulon sensor histidine kinase PhoR [Nitrosomonas sp. Nm51]|uniref:phosphate regulon sensor histidine kinase PhoR n=1 Tax=Nitrosomonas sp. Nm51 TaxID=133720 RepID=UPI0008D6CA75|nr:phosphate regulon sensor histidine kinase PhoR [Nitrosomonas sp. Nm51]SER50535.1 two-component system, OmpR family, phosphate regulon sensor histidine kinase PhoR [Nitrosomonas sp. Nm51]